MANADDRRNGEAVDDVWAQVVAEDAERLAREAQQRAAAETVEQAEHAPASDPLTRLLGGEAPFGSELGPLVDEVRRLAATIGDRLQKAQRTTDALATGATGLEQLTAPLREKHPEVYRHLAAAGNELLAAYRAAVSGQERRWTGGKPPSSEHIDLD
jgi:hypothetical protein